jgi:WD40 repeat protein
MIGRPSKLSVGMLVILMVFSSVLPLVNADEGPGQDEIPESLIEDPVEQPNELRNMNDAQEAPDVPNVSQSLLSWMSSKEKIPIIIATTDISELSAALEGVDFDGFLGTEKSDLDSISLPLLNVPGYAIERIASLPSTIYVEEFEPPVADYAPSYEPLSARRIVANNLNATINHGADLAWAKNYTGKDVTIAVIDDGIDFAHPDLMDKMARVDSIFEVVKEVVVESASPGQTFAALKNFDIVDSSYTLYKNDGVMSSGYTLDIWDGTIQFTPLPLSQGDKIEVTYKFYSPYYGWPICFDPASLATLISTRYPTDTWYANTTSDDRNVTHTIKIDGRFDFWDDGSELVSTDSNADIITRPGQPTHEGNDYNLVSLYVTQDADYWYFGFDSMANQTTMRFGLYIDTTNSPGIDPGATFDPINRNPVTNETLIDTTDAHKPELAVYIMHQGGEERANWSKNDTIEDATVYIWNELGSDWSPGYSIKGKDVGGDIGYDGWDYEDLRGVVEFSIPKSVLGDPVNISAILFTTGFYPSHAQDTAYTDPAVTYTQPDWSMTKTTLSSFTIVGKDFAAEKGFWRHTYTRPDDTIAGVPNTNRTWPLKYITTGTSKSGKYWFGDHQDENYPLTRILVVDEHEAGVYDTIYADLDHNRDFNNDKPVKKYGKYDSEMKWHEPNWTGVGTIHDDVIYGDFFDPAEGITSVDWSHDGMMIASGSDDHTIVIWDLGPPISYQKQLHAHYGRVKSVRWSPVDSTRLATAYDDPSGNGDFTVAVWDVPNGIIEYNLTGHTDGVWAVDWSPTGDRIVSASLDGTLKIWDATTGTLIKTFTDHTGPVYDVHWASDGRIASASEDMTVKIWDADAAPGSAVIDEISYLNPVTAVAINSDYNWLAYGSTDGVITIRDMTNATSVTHLPHFGNRRVWSLRWAPGGLRLASTAGIRLDSINDPTISVMQWFTSPSIDYWRFGSQEEYGHHDGEPVRAAGWSPSNETSLFTGGDDSSIQLWTCTGDHAVGLLSIDPNGQSFKGHQDYSLDYTRWNTGDGLPDVSGGMVYYIAQHRYNAVRNELQEIPIPYSETYVERLGGETRNYIAANGTMVAIMGSLDEDMGHGTLVASAISGKGISEYFDSAGMDEPTVGHVLGYAPDAKLIAVANIYYSNFYDGWYFAVEGYDGERDTGDEPLIASNSYGFASVRYAGFDFKSRFLDWLVNTYSNRKVTFTFSAGNSGYGYGTVSTPASSPGVITVGSSTDFFYRHLSGLETGANPTYGDVAFESARGPTMMGEPDPDILANGRMAFGDVALNQVDYRPYDGSQATNLWAGTSLASPGVAGMLALMFEAYKKTHGVYPDAATAKSMVMSSGDDINYDVMSQGAGLLNADRLTDLASDTDGVMVSPNQWVPGNYQGTRYPSYTKLMYPGQQEDNAMTFTLENHNPSVQKNVDLYDAVYQRTDEVNYSFVTIAEDRAEWQYILATSRYAITDPIGQPGVYDPGVYDMDQKKLADVNLTHWLNADLLRITMYMNWTTLDDNADGNPEYSYFLDLYDWTANPVDIPPEPHPSDYHDMNRLLIVYPDSNIFEGRIHNPAQRTHDGLVIGTRSGIQANRLGAVGGTIYISIEFFEKMDWNWLSLDQTSLLIDGGNSDTFTATVDVPMDTSVGSYQGGIYISSEGGFENETTVIDNNWGPRFVRLERYHVKDATVYVNSALQTEGVDYVLHADTGVVEFLNPLGWFNTVIVNYTYYHVTTIPVLVNVPSDSVEFSFGGIEQGQDDFYANRVNGGFGNGAKSGEWRYYYVDVPDQGMFASGVGAKFLADVWWDKPRTDLDVLAFGPGGARSPLDPKVSLSSEVYGPYEIYKENGGSEETANFFTTTGLNEEIVAPRISGGLNVLAVHQVRSNGTIHLEDVAGNVASMSVVPEELKIVTNSLIGQREIQLHSTIPWFGIGSQSAGPSPPVREINVHIKQDNIEGDSFIKMLAEGDYTKVVNVQKTALIFAVNITSLKEWTEKPCPDLDLGVFLDGKGPDNTPDGEATEDEFVAYGADADAEEFVRLIKPPVFDDPDTPNINEEEEGVPYIIKVLGFTVPGNDGTFNIDVTLVQGAGFEVEGLKEEDEEWGPLNLSKILLKWDLAGNTTDGKLLGALYLGPYRSPFTVLVPVELVVDRVKPVVTDFALRAIGKDIDSIDNRTTNHKQPDISCTLRDEERGELDWTSVRVFFDGENVTSITDINIEFSEKTGKYGYYEGKVTYTPPSTLSEGRHSFEVYSSDIAGNEVYGKMDFMIDSSSPDLILEGSPVEATTSPIATVSGWTEPDKTVIIREKTVIADEEGYFEAGLDLVEGENVIDVVVVDFFSLSTLGETIRSNTRILQQTFIYDVEPPTLSDLRFDRTTPTKSELAILTGKVEDLIAEATYYDPSSVEVKVNGEPLYVDSDGSFRVTVSLDEGLNVHLIEATDLAGHSVSAYRNITRDTVAPSIDLESLPSRTEQGAITIRGTTDVGSIVTVNGKIVSVDSLGDFEESIILVPGANQIVVESVDSAGNARSSRLVIEMTIPDYMPYMFVVVGIVIGLIVGLFVGTRFAPKGEEEELEEEELLEEEVPEEIAEEEIPEKMPEEEELAPLPEEEPSPPEEKPEEPEVPPEEPVEDEKITRLKKAYEEGKLSKELYELNLKKLQKK